MRIAKNTELLLTEAPTSRFLLVIDVMDGEVSLSKGGDTILRIFLQGEDVYARLFYPDGREKTLFGGGARGKEVILTAGYARLGLYVGGVLLDEDFFDTPLDYQGATVRAGSFMHFEAGYEYHSAEESAIVETLTDTLDGYRLYPSTHSVFRPLPTVTGDRLHLLYLDERRGIPSGKDKTAHKLLAMFSDDGKIFHGAPIALGIDNVREDSILDAALLKKDGRYYLYYLVAYTTHRALSCAVSEDGFSFQKTGLDVEISGVKNASVSAIAVLDAPTPRLYFVAEGRAYYAESIDLLHFSSPIPLADLALDKIIPIEKGKKELLFAQKDGMLFRMQDATLSRVENAPSFAVPFVYHGKLYAIGIRDGAFAYTTL